VVPLQCHIPLEKWELHFNSILNINKFSKNDSLRLFNLLRNYNCDIPYNAFSVQSIQYNLNKMKNKKAPVPDFVTKEHLQIHT
jgi:hypothetical protein